MRLVCFLCAFRALSLGGSSLGDFAMSDFDFIVTLPDIHGDLEYLMYSIVLAAKNTNYPNLSVSDLEEHLISGSAASGAIGKPGRTALIQLGDVINRGPGSKQCLTVLFSLEHILGWRIISLYGNHELMAFTGKDGRYVSELEYEFYASREERAAEFSPSGTLWQNIRSHSLLMARFTSTSSLSKNILFVHAGLDLEWLGDIGSELSKSVHGMNALAAAFMSDPAKAEGLFGPKSSPLWTRDFEVSSQSPDWCNNEFKTILERLNISRIVVGHCPLESKRVETRCNGSLILTDVKLSRWMGDGGQPVAIIFKTSSDFSIEAHYLDPENLELEFKETIVAPEQSPEEVSGRLRSRSVDDASFIRKLTLETQAMNARLRNGPAYRLIAQLGNKITGDFPRIVGCGLPILRRSSSCPLPSEVPHT
jgi:hypothetical protein